MAIGIDSSSHIGLGQSSHSKGPLATNLERLSTGKKINSAADDAAAIAIVARFATQIDGSNQAYRNVNDGISLAQTGEAATGEIGEQVQRIRELAVQSANATLSDTDRASLQQEVSTLQQDISRITGNADFNGVQLLDNAATLQFQTGPDAGNQVGVDTKDLATDLNNAGVNTIDISTAAGASAALDVADQALELVNQTRSGFGAIQSSFESAARNLQNVAENLAAAKSRIEDADFAQETANFTKNLIQQQASNAVNGQANAMQQQVLSLLG